MSGSSDRSKLIVFFEGNTRKHSTIWSKTIASWQTSYTHVKICRDTSCRWYLQDLDRWIEQTKRLCEQHDDVVFIGRSSGGYLAVLLSSMIDARVVACHEPQTRVDMLPKRVRELHLRDRDHLVNLRDHINPRCEYYIYNKKNSKDIRHGYMHYQNIACYSNVHHVQHSRNWLEHVKSII